MPERVKFMKPTEILTGFIANTSWEDIPKEAGLRSKWAILDCIAVTFAGLQHEVGREIISFVKDLEGRPLCPCSTGGKKRRQDWESSFYEEA